MSFKAEHILRDFK